ncbi:MAG: DUF2911 domain-containing protein [Flavobacteriales bacterium]|jgi:hypothetical protein|nr:DUF2911 domain-containing protein [Flavobacteriales bacterium]
MHLKTLTLAAATAAFTLHAHAQQLPQPSPLAKIEQQVGLTQVTIEYSRPSAKGRTIFGELVPYGEIWRTGANASTKVTVDGPVTIDGQPVKPGTYALLTVPGKDAWRIMLNSDSKVNNGRDHKAENDVVATKAVPGRTEHVETFTIGLANVVNDGATVELSWANTKVGFRIEAPATEQALKNIETALAGDDVSAGTYHSAARFCMDRGVHKDKVLEWAKKSVAMDDTRFWTQHTLALAYAESGDKKNAIAAARKSSELARKADAANYVKMNEEKIAEWSK